MVKFIHTSDLHLGKPFGRFGEDLRVRLREARHEKIFELARIARTEGASAVLLAGDTFDAETPSPQVVRHAMRAFAAEPDITWYLMPGNHDSLAAGDLWDRASKDAPANVVLALDASPLRLGEEAVILPAPPTSRSPGRDLTEWMDDADLGEARHLVRIGLAHGSIQDFGSSEGEASGIITPDRPRRANLDYLALGDWHGRIKVGDRCWYSGSPEADSFKHQAMPGALLVDIDGPGSTPIVTEIETGKFVWIEADIDFRPGEDIAGRLASGLPAIAKRRDALVSLQIKGRLSLSDRSKLSEELEHVADDFAFFESDLSGLFIEQEAGDLDDIDTGGALRVAAEALSANAANEERDETARQISSAALARLYAYAVGERA